MEQIARCRAEQAEALANLVAEPGSFVAALGAEDWMKEELEIMLIEGGAMGTERLDLRAPFP